MITKEAMDFLVENKLRNDRPWYNERKGEFQEKVVAPLQDLVTRLTPTMREIDPRFEFAPKVDKTISRVYRDTRFTHDKSLFRDVMWIVFKRAKVFELEGVPGFWWEMSPSGMIYGMGAFQPSRIYQEEMRRRILARDPLFIKAKKLYEKQDVFELEGDRFKRSKHPEQSEEIKFWLDRKSCTLMTKSKDFDLLFSDRLADKLSADFKLLQPMFLFWSSVAETMNLENS